MPSNLIVIPTAEEIKTLGKPAKSRDLDLPLLQKQTKQVQPITAENLVGRTLMLNTALASKFQCGGFSLGMLHMIGVVTTDTQLIPVLKALAEEKLIDITDSDKADGIKNRHGSASAVKTEETGRKVFLTKDMSGNMAVVVPKNAKEQAKFERQIEKTGAIDVDYIPAPPKTSGLGKVTVEEIPVKKAKNVSTRRNSSRTR